jgi:hypothetical protein
MHWGREHSVGHYLDLTSAVLGLTLFPLGYLFYAIKKWAQEAKANWREF